MNPLPIGDRGQRFEILARFTGEPYDSVIGYAKTTKDRDKALATLCANHPSTKFWAKDRHATA